jgi:co-chaperonin GroES (HSP10)
MNDREAMINRRTERLEAEMLASKSTNEAGITPVGHCILVRMDEVERTTASGIVIRDEQADKEEMSGTKATVIAVGACAWSDQKQPWAKVGDNIMMAKFAGQLWQVGKVKYRIISDLSVCGVIHDGEGK